MIISVYLKKGRYFTHFSCLMSISRHKCTCPCSCLTISLAAQTPPHPGLSVNRQPDVEISTFHTWSGLQSARFVLIGHRKSLRFHTDSCVRLECEMLDSFLVVSSLMPLLPPRSAHLFSFPLRGVLHPGAVLQTRGSSSGSICQLGRYL